MGTRTRSMQDDNERASERVAGRAASHLTGPSIGLSASSSPPSYNSLFLGRERLSSGGVVSPLCLSARADCIREISVLRESVQTFAQAIPRDERERERARAFGALPVAVVGTTSARQGSNRVNQINALALPRLCRYRVSARLTMKLVAIAVVAIATAATTAAA